MAEKFAGANFIFVKFNFSHNRTTPDQPDEFTDLEAFGNNNPPIGLHGFMLHVLLNFPWQLMKSFAF